ncbi:uncharacterized protein BX664DRAFT_355264 [Halteromyces radiatus]|uniref:uncharacterized protein n=1 Tax=Halteromyces radiatus TaxID=101107 RepID=UPI00221F66EE|nr:uncharacterized protein BX664DRAFT_355264 [Halteromyces radiatus]KAI8099890.1 hypothetical protein BX664DRAFT_355264 [Halteromyces radiatus]
MFKSGIGSSQNKSIPSSSSSSSSTSSTKSRTSLRLLATRGFRQRPLSIRSTATSSSNQSFYSQSSNNINLEQTGINYSNYNNNNNSSMYSRQQRAASDPISSPHMMEGNTLYYTTTADYDGTMPADTTSRRMERSRNNSDQPISPMATTMRSLSPPSLYDIRNSYEDPDQSFASPPPINEPDPSQSIFPPTSEMQHIANMDLEANNKIFKVMYAGIVTYKTISALIPVNKRLYFVLTNHHLLQYKSEQKARSEIDLFDTQHHRHHDNVTSTSFSPLPRIAQDKIVVHLRDIFGIHTVISPPNTFRVEYLQPDTKQPQTLVLTANSPKECQQWIDGFRHAIKVHHVSMMAQGTVTTTEKFAAEERLSKQKDMVDKRRNPLMIHKVIYKEKRIKVTDGKNSTKEVFQVVTLAIGKFSMYLLPPSGVADDKYLKAVERDRYGLLAIHSIQYSADDDTFKLLIGQVGHPTRQLVLVSTYCEYIIQHLRQAIHAVSLDAQAITYSATLPAHLQQAYITPLQTLVDDDNIVDNNNQINTNPSQMIDPADENAVRFNIVLHAYCAALNLNKARFQYKLDGISGGARSFVLLPPHEVNETSASYTRYELLAICRSLHRNPFYTELNFGKQSLKELEDWTVDKNDSWTKPFWKTLNVSDVLSNELHAILSGNARLQRLDLSECSIGSNKTSTSSALTVIGLNMRNGNCQLRSVMLGKNHMKATDLHSLLAGIRASPKAVVELDVHECGLTDEQIGMLLTTLLSERPEKLQLLDISTTSRDPHPHHSHYRHQRQPPTSPTTTAHDKSETSKGRLDLTTIQSLLQRCKRLAVLRLRGYDLSLEKHMFDASALRELDLGYNRLGTSGVAILCQWMQTQSFNSVEALNVNGCGLDGRHLRDLLMAITKSGNRRVHLNVGGNPVWREVMYIPNLCNALMQGEGPCSMSLAKTDWEDGTLREFLDCIRDNHTIMFLDLSDIRVTGCDALSDDTVRVLASVFERNTTLRELKLNMTSARNKEGCANIGKGIVDAIDAGLKQNRSLERLELNGVGIGDVGASVLANVMTVNRVLQSLHIDENKITIDGYRALVAAFEAGTSVVDLPKPKMDIRHQLTILKETINELTQIENETRWFIMHSTGTDVKHAKTQLLMQLQARQTAELNYKQILDVVDDMLRLVARNGQRFNTSQDRVREIQLQAQSAAQELAIAQLRLQSTRVTSANLSAVGVPRGRARNSSTSSYSSSSNSDRGTAMAPSISSTMQSSQQYIYGNNSHSRSPTMDSASQRPLSPLSGNSSYYYYYKNGNNGSESPMTSTSTPYYSPSDFPTNQPLPPAPQLYDGSAFNSGNSISGHSNHSGGSSGSLSRRNTATTSISSPRTPHGTTGLYLSASLSSSFPNKGGRRGQPIVAYDDDDDNGSEYTLDHPGFIEDFGGKSSSGSSRRHDYRLQQQQPRQQFIRLPDIPDSYSHDSLHDEDRLCDQFKNRMYLPPDECD